MVRNVTSLPLDNLVWGGTLASHGHFELAVFKVHQRLRVSNHIGKVTFLIRILPLLSRE